MSKITLDPELRAKLNGLNQPLELCDADGRTLGHFLPAEAYRKLLYAAVEAACPHGPEELERRRNEKGAKEIKLAEFWKTLEQS
jgi:hypothetical protein